MKADESYLADLRDGQAVYGYPGGDYPGRQYYVNNITGSSGGDGSDWENAMDEVSTAITAAEAYRISAVFPNSTNQYIRNQIFAQGTGTPYSEITALPSYCDLIGLGADPFGNGAGIARIGADTGTGENGLSGTSSVRGLRMRGFQFQAGNGGYAFQMSNIFRSRIEHCVFATNGSPAGAPAVGFEIAIGSGLVMDDCHWLNQSSITNSNDVGFSVTGTHFHGCKVTNCNISGADAALQIGSTVINGYNSEFVNCFFGWGSETCAIGIDDNATVGHIIYRRCDIFATDPIELTHNAANRAIGCMSADGFVIT
ncbi:MAG TPA: hypothetical protein ENI05_01140 [Porticoccus sp.]|nr:hypothetical protein [Porticoccus sp.]